VGSPRRSGNTATAVRVATDELERRGVQCETVMLCDFVASFFDVALGDGSPAGGDDCAEELLDGVWAAQGLILATPIYFCTMSAQMKAFMDRTNDRFMTERWLAPRVVGLMAVGAEGGFAENIAAMRRYLDLMAPSHPPIEVAVGHADVVGDAPRSQEVQEAARTMAARMADILLG
jgi:multimeric flavodoxin WrbA